MREPQRYIKFSTNFMVTICQNSDAHTMGVNYCLREKRKSFGFFSFLFVHCQKLSKTQDYFVAKYPLNLFWKVLRFYSQPTKKLLKLICYVTLGLADGSMDL